MSRKTRVVHKPEELERLVNKAVEILKDSFIAPSQRTLFERAQEAVLDRDRHQMVTGAKASWLMSEAQKRLLQATPPPPPPAPAPQSLDQLAHALVDAFLAREERLHSEIQDLKKTVSQFQTLLTKILGDLSPYMPEQEKPKEEHKPDTRIRVALLGPLANQAETIKRKVGGIAIIQWIENEKHFNASSLKNFDYAVITRHTRHSHTEQALQALGRDRVVRLTTGGIDRAADAIEKLTKLPKGKPAYSVVHS